MNRLEVNPKRISGENQYSQAEENAQHLLHVAELLWKSIVSHIDACPVQIRDAIRMVTELSFFADRDIPGIPPLSSFSPLSSDCMPPFSFSYLFSETTTVSGVSNRHINRCTNYCSEQYVLLALYLLRNLLSTAIRNCIRYERV